MADTSAERVGVLMDGLMRLLAEHPDGIRAKDALVELERRVPPTPYESGTYSDGLPRFGKVVRFATIDLAKAGWITKQRGYWTITAEGQLALTAIPDAVERYKRARALYQEWRRQTPRDAAPGPEEIDVPEDADLGAVLETAEGDAWDQISTHLARIDPYELQELTAALLTGMGYHVIWNAPPGRDGGVDVIAYTDPLGTTGPRIKVQVKRWEQKVNAEGLRSFLSLLSTTDVGVFFCTGGFTRDAEEQARGQETRRITLLDADKFFRLWIEHYARIPETSRAKLPIRPVYFLDHTALD